MGSAALVAGSWIWPQGGFPAIPSDLHHYLIGSGRAQCRHELLSLELHRRDPGSPPGARWIRAADSIDLPLVSASLIQLQDPVWKVTLAE